jgi:hypothetical protein
MPHSVVALAEAVSWKAPNTPGTSGLVATVTCTVATRAPDGATQLTIVVLVTRSTPVDSFCP